MGMIITPITNPALRALKIMRLSKIPCRSGVTKVRAKYPYTTVGIPARISRIGFMILLILSGAYSDRNIAVINPIGKATAAAMSVTSNVPDTRGRTP